MMNSIKITLAAVAVFLLVLTRPCLAVTGILLADDQANIIYEENKDRQFVPASILKILTSLTAIQTLGLEYRFKTVYAHDPTTNNLYIKGYGEPLFISEVIRKFCREIVKNTKLTQINKIIIDQSFFHPGISIPGTGNSLNPYDATTGALCANFNTISFNWDQTLGQYKSAEAQTPLLPDFIEDIHGSGQKNGRILLSPGQRSLYPGMLVKYFLEEIGVEVIGSVRLGNFKDSPNQSFTFESPFTLGQVIEKLLFYSNNFMANQVMLTMGALSSGQPATLDKGIVLIEAFSRTELGLAGIRIAEGSGISRKNKISPRQMLKVLIAFMPYYSLMQQKENEYFKTGTLSDVRTRAGYFLGKDGRLYPFVIMVNKKNTGYEKIRRKLKNKVNRISTN